MDLEAIKSSEKMKELIRRRLPDFPESEAPRLKNIQLLDIVDDYCSLFVYITNEAYSFEYVGNKSDPVYEILKDAKS